MSSRLAKLDNDLMKVPKLEAGGVNWVVYKVRFVWSIDARGLLEHVDGSEREPVCQVNPEWSQRRIPWATTPVKWSRLSIHVRRRV